MASRVGINGVAMAAMAFLLALLPVPGAEAQVLNCSVPCNTTYQACMTPCISIDNFLALECAGACEEARDACTRSCKQGCAVINSGGTRQFNCSVPCATAYKACDDGCNFVPVPVEEFVVACRAGCKTVRDECDGRCKLGCATV